MNRIQGVLDLEHFAHRLLVDAVCDATRQWWLRRAEDFERAKPVPGDFNGNATIEQLRARWRRCHESARACRNKAALVPLDREDVDAEVARILDVEAV